MDYGKDWFEDSCPCQMCKADDGIDASSAPDNREVKKRQLVAKNERNRRRRKAKKDAKNTTAMCKKVP